MGEAQNTSPLPAPPKGAWVLLKGIVTSVTGPWTLKNGLTWAVLILACLLLKACLIDQYLIPSGSMEPTLHGVGRYFSDDRVLVNKWRFGPRIPLTTMRLAKWGEPERWDIVVFKAVEENAKHGTLIKRVAGLPGERVHIEDGTLYINGEAVDPPEELRGILNYTRHFGLPPIEVKRAFLELAQENKPLSVANPRHKDIIALYQDMEKFHPKVTRVSLDLLDKTEVERLAAGVSRTSLGVVEQLFALDPTPLAFGIREEDKYAVVPEDHYFLLGDNSLQSRDGRVWGWVPHRHLLGRASGIWWPFARRRDFTGFSGTWWGMLLIYGIPALLVGLEVRHHFRRRPEASGDS